MKEKVVIITGGSSGIGKALATTFGKNGSKVIITGRKQEELDATVKELKALGIEVTGIQGDVSSPEENKRMVEATVAKYGGIDVLVNNAGISMRALFEELNYEVIKRVMDINFFGAVNMTHLCLPYLLKSKGIVVGISSIAGYRGLPGRTGYSASKFALNGFLESLRAEMINKGVHVLIASPGFTGSNIRKRSLTKDGTPQGDSPREEEKMMTPEECAYHIYRATVKRKKVLILTAQGRWTVFLNKWFPGMMDKVAYEAMAREENSPFK